VQQRGSFSLATKHTGRQPAQAAKAAKAAGLYYVNDGEPGLTRAGHAKSALRAADGAVVRDRRIRERVRRLVIPPAWTNVWICPTPDGHIQAMGQDQRGRRQYIYHSAWREIRDRAKFERLAAFARALPRIRARVMRDLAKRSLSRERVLALVLHLLDTTYARVGNEEYARSNGSFGLTTLRDRHARITGSSLLFEFRAKSGKMQRLHLSDRKLARMVKACQDLPGQRLFQYLDDGVAKPITSSDVNAYLREISGDDFTAKDFRTWAGTVLAAEELCKNASLGQSRRHGVPAAIKAVAVKLGNTPAICRKSYIHPAVIEGHKSGTLARRLRSFPTQRRRVSAALSDSEAAVLAFLSGPPRLTSRDRGPLLAAATATQPLGSIQRSAH
jgi:DNA topoisomerase-1